MRRKEGGGIWKETRGRRKDDEKRGRRKTEGDKRKEEG
jgi:hypothetical protein